MIQKNLKIFSGDGIVALSTPVGRSAIAVIRGSGEGIIEIFQRSLKIRPSILNGEANHSYVVDFEVGEISDRAVATIYRAPRSYTGEDMIEFSVHGNPVLAEAIIRTLTDNGARLAEPGEFTMRATANGKMNIIEAEAVFYTVEAQTERALKASRRTVKDIPEIADARARIHDALIKLSTILEFPEDDIDEIDTSSLCAEINDSSVLIENFIERAECSTPLVNGMTIAIAGEVNAGKSTLFNRILGMERAIVTPHPGTTRDIIEATIEISGVPVKILDTAGIRDSAHPVETEGIRRAKMATRDADIVIWLIDASKPITQIPHNDENTIIVLNKSDIGVLEENLKNFPDAVIISALTGNNFEKLLIKLEEKFLKIPADSLIASERTMTILKNTAEELKTTIDAMNKNFFDVAQVSLERADLFIGEIFEPEIDRDLYDEIFKNFCIGK